MARPKTNNLKFFPLEVDFFDDEKIAALSGEFGIIAEAVVVRLLCTIYSQGYYLHLSDLVRLKLLRDIRPVTDASFDAILQRLLQYGFFDPDIYASDRILTSKAIQRRYFDAAQRRRLPADMPYLLIDSAPHTTTSKAATPAKATARPAAQADSVQPEQPAHTPDAGSTDSPQSPPHYLDDLLSPDSTTANLILIQYRIDHPTLCRYIQDFYLHCASREKQHTDRNDALNHFHDWLRKSATVPAASAAALNTQKHETNSRPNKRRGVPAPPPAASPDEYAEAF